MMRKSLCWLGVFLALAGDLVGGEGLEAYCILIEPSFEKAEVSSEIPGSERTLLVAAKEDEGEGVSYYTQADFEALGVDWLKFMAKSRESADRLLATLKPEYERDHRGVVKYGVLRSESHRTASVVLASTFREKFKKTLGEDLSVLIPDRFTVFVFPKLVSDYEAYGESTVEMYGDATYGVSVEVFTVDDEGLQVIGRFADGS
jgi:hypothetical protein